MLNREQYRASRSDGGISLVVAGAGTGKTTVLVEKVKSLIKYGGVPPEKILLLTFSKKAAEELRERIGRDVPGAGLQIHAGTFHSFCYSVIREFRETFAREYGFTGPPKVADESSRHDFYRDYVCGNLARFKGMPADIAADILMNYGKLGRKSRDRLESLDMGRISDDVAQLYREHKIVNCLIDFDDMLDMIPRMIEKDRRFGEILTNRFSHVLVDEFQDTSQSNFNLIRLLIGSSGGNFFAVGDDWQSIYGFRNARVGYMLNFRRFFSNATIHVLRVNYRSKKEIVALSSGFIRKNRHRSVKRIISHRGKGGLARIIAVRDRDEEIGRIRRLLGDYAGYGSVAVLARNNRQVALLERETGSANGVHAEVVYMTMHGSKGLEFDTVIVAGVSDLVIPDRSTDIEEERRLMYVALSRARDRLFVIVHLNDDGSPARFGAELGLRI